jgi:alkanesulfonate monooxygenase SsuD/methylene tetrahydromethanopterin reductase-like flavin-dependent oxidoreductase (luciferase family)
MSERLTSSGGATQGGPASAAVAGARAPTFGLLPPLTPVSDHPPTGDLRVQHGDDGLAGLVREGLVDAIWLRDLPVVPNADDDAGQGTDPFAHLAHLAGMRALPAVVGTASVILGTRHPLVLARAALTVQAQTEGRLVLGLGTGGKPAMNAALGVTNQTLDSFAQEWWAVRRALRGDVGDDVQLRMPVPSRPPPLYLATTDTERWRALDGDPEGWLAFAGEEDAFGAQLDELCRISARPVDAAIRFDLTVVPRDGPRSELVPVRGRAAGTIDQLCALLARWLRLPVRHHLVNVRSDDPVADLRRLRAVYDERPSSVPVPPQASSAGLPQD